MSDSDTVGNTGIVQPRRSTRKIPEKPQPPEPLILIMEPIKNSLVLCPDRHYFEDIEKNVKLKWRGKRKRDRYIRLRLPEYVSIYYFARSVYRV